ncbi:hypothetical protein RFX70_12020, partial [Acinetobacter baumannii]|nr:hypothetical protein [Acinetobacter baumannii]
LPLDNSNVEVDVKFNKDDTILQNGKVVLFSDMNEDQVKQQLFNSLVTNKEGLNYKDYEWENYNTGHYMLYY